MNSNNFYGLDILEQVKRRLRNKVDGMFEKHPIEMTAKTLDIPEEDVTDKDIKKAKRLAFDAIDSEAEKTRKEME